MTKDIHERRPGLALIANCITPYRVNLHKLIAGGIPELKLHSLITHADADFRWDVDIPASINAQSFGRPGDSPLASSRSAPVWEWCKGGRLIEYIREHDVRAVVCTGYRYISYLRTIRYCHGAGIPLFVRNDSNIRSEPALSPLKQAAKAKLYSWWIRRVAGVMPMGEYGAQFFQKYGADPRQMYRVPYTPDYGYFAVVDEQRLQQFRERYGLCAGRRYFLFSGRLVPVKRVDLLIGAFSAIAAERPNWDVLIVGDGHLGEQLRRMLPEPLKSRVVWTGFLEQQDAKLAYHCADVLFLPSDREPWGVVVQEGMAAGLTIIASDVVGAAHELITDNVSGRFFETGSVESLRRVMCDVSQPDRIDAFKEQSRLALDGWRNRVDPISEIRRALEDFGVLGGSCRIKSAPRGDDRVDDGKQ
jgi:glycosyltransferase involved in cell wall biosynthesis